MTDDILVDYRNLFYNQDKNVLRRNKTKNNGVTVNLTFCVYVNDYKDSYPINYEVSMEWLISYMNRDYKDIHKNWSSDNVIEWLSEYTSEESNTIFCVACIENQVLRYEEL